MLTPRKAAPTTVDAIAKYRSTAPKPKIAIKTPKATIIAPSITRELTRQLDYQASEGMNYNIHK